MIPMDMGQEQVNIITLRIFREGVTQESDTCAAVNDYPLARACRDLQTGGVSAVMNRISAGRGDGTSYAPKGDFHTRPIIPMTILSRLGRKFTQ